VCASLSSAYRSERPPPRDRPAVGRLAGTSVSPRTPLCEGPHLCPSRVARPGAGQHCAPRWLEDYKRMRPASPGWGAYAIAPGNVDVGLGAECAPALRALSTFLESEAAAGP